MDSMAMELYMYAFPWTKRIWDELQCWQLSQEVVHETRPAITVGVYSSMPQLSCTQIIPSCAACMTYMYIVKCVPEWVVARSSPRSGWLHVCVSMYFVSLQCVCLLHISACELEWVIARFSTLGMFASERAVAVSFPHSGWLCVSVYLSSHSC